MKIVHNIIIGIIISIVVVSSMSIISEEYTCISPFDFEDVENNCVDILVKNDDNVSTVIEDIADHLRNYRNQNYVYPSISSPVALTHGHLWHNFLQDLKVASVQEETNLKISDLNWSKDLMRGPIGSSIAGSDGLLYVLVGGSDDKSPAAVCIDMSGEIIWESETPNLNTSNRPLIYGDNLIVTSIDGYIYGLNITCGKQDWRFSLGHGGKFTSPVSHNSSIIMVADNGKLLSINPKNTNGRMGEWISDLSEGIYSSDPIIYDNIIYIGDSAGRVSAYSVDGSLLWDRSICVDNGIYSSRLIDIDRNHIIILSVGTDGEIISINFEGVIKWRTTIGETSARIAMSSNGYVVAAANNIIMIDFNGDELWRYHIGETMGGGAPIIVGDKIFTVTNESSSRLITINLDGKPIDELILEPAQYSLCSPIVVDKSMFVTSSNGHIYAFSMVEDISDANNYPIIDDAQAVDNETRDNDPIIVVSIITITLFITTLIYYFWVRKRR